MFVFRKIWLALFSCKTCFEICPFALLPRKSRHKSLTHNLVNLIGGRGTVTVQEKGFFIVLFAFVRKIL